MKLSIILRIILTEVNAICWSWRLRRIILTEVWIILHIMRKPNPIIVLLYIQNSDRYKKGCAVKRFVRLTFQTAAGHFCCFVIFAALRWFRHQHPIIFFFWIATSKNSRYSAKWCLGFRTSRVNWWMSTSKKQKWSLNVWLFVLATDELGLVDVLTDLQEHNSQRMERTFSKYYRVFLTAWGKVELYP